MLSGFNAKTHNNDNIPNRRIKWIFNVFIIVALWIQYWVLVFCLFLIDMLLKCLFIHLTQCLLKQLRIFYCIEQWCFLLHLVDNLTTLLVSSLMFYFINKRDKLININIYAMFHAFALLLNVSVYNHDPMNSHEWMHLVIQEPLTI